MSDFKLQYNISKAGIKCFCMSLQ